MIEIVRTAEEYEEECKLVEMYVRQACVCPSCGVDEHVVVEKGIGDIIYMSTCHNCGTLWHTLKEKGE